MNKKQTLLFGLVLALLSTFPASAVIIDSNVVKFSQGVNMGVEFGDTFTVDVVGENFIAGPDGAAFSVSWNPAVLSYVSTTVANPPWDTFFIDDDDASSSGQIDRIFLGKSVGNAGADFALASITFDVLDNQDALTMLSLSNDSSNVGFVAPGGELITDVTYFDSRVIISTPAAVPVPAAVWLFGTGLIGLMLPKKS